MVFQLGNLRSVIYSPRPGAICLWRSYIQCGYPVDEFEAIVSAFFPTGSNMDLNGINMSLLNLLYSLSETHYKTIIVIIGFLVTVSGWWAWNAFLAGVYVAQPGPYSARGGFMNTFGKDPVWWLTLILVFAILVVLKVVYGSINRNFISVAMKLLRRKVKWLGGNEDSDIRTFQEMEQVPAIRERLKRMARDEDMDEVEYINVND